MTNKKDFTKEYNLILDSVKFIRGVDNDKEINKSYVDAYTTKEQKNRDEKITELLEFYVDGYKNKINSNKWYKGILVFICIGILVTLCIFFMFFISRVDLNSQNSSVSEMIQLVSVCITFLGLIVGILKIITKYVFPENEEEYITRIVEMIQKNDLENKKENIKAQIFKDDNER